MAQTSRLSNSTSRRISSGGYELLKEREPKVRSHLLTVLGGTPKMTGRMLLGSHQFILNCARTMNRSFALMENANGVGRSRHFSRHFERVGISVRLVRMDDEAD